MFILNKTRKCEGMRRNSTPFLFWMTKQHSSDVSILFFSRTVHSKSRFFSQQPSEQWVLPFFKWQRVFLVIHLLSSGSTLQTISSSFFSLPLTLIIFMWRISIPIIILPFQFIRFFSLPSFVSNLNHLHRINGVYSCVFLWTSF